MTISITHPFISAKGDGGDATLVRPSNWNANHTTSIATGKLVGRTSPGVGAFEEISISALVAAALDETTGEAFLAALGLAAFATGDVKYTFAATAPAGWVLMLGGTGTPPDTIGNAASGASLRASADCLNLFVLLYGSVADADAPVSGGRSGNATNDFNANKTIRIPNLVGRAPIGAGTATSAPPGGGAATTAKTLGKGYGSETVTLVTGNLPPYTPQGTLASITSTQTNIPSGQGGSSAPNTGGSRTVADWGGGVATLGQITSTGSFNGTAQGGVNTPVNTIHSSIALNVMVKL